MTVFAKKDHGFDSDDKLHSAAKRYLESGAHNLVFFSNDSGKQNTGRSRHGFSENHPVIIFEKSDFSAVRQFIHQFDDFDGQCVDLVDRQEKKETIFGPTKDYTVTLKISVDATDPQSAAERALSMSKDLVDQAYFKVESSDLNEAPLFFDLNDKNIELLTDEDDPDVDCAGMR